MPVDGPGTLPAGSSPPQDAAEAQNVAAPDLAQRVRRGTDAYAFDALLNGVSRPTKPVEPPSANTPPPERVAPLPKHERAPGEPGSPPPAPRRRWLWVTLLLVVLVGITASVALQAVRPSSKKTPAAAAALNPLVKQGLPDRNLTPGDLGPSTGLIRPEVRQAVLRSYGVNPNDPQFVLCTLIPLTLGGSERSSNLFPTTRWFAKLKARVDAALTAQVKSGGITTEAARAQLQANWIKAAHSNYVRNYGERSPKKARAVEDRLAW